MLNRSSLSAYRPQSFSIININDISTTSSIILHYQHTRFDVLIISTFDVCLYYFVINT
ncbi:hypothetical protein Hanom_Chr01g00050791 [Helianthus anomalus]